MSLLIQNKPDQAFLQKIQELDSDCTEDEFDKAKEVLAIHDQIEIAAYRALVEIVKKLQLKEDSISEEESGEILTQVKKSAHVEMYKKGGYISERGNLLNPSQIEYLMKNVDAIVHDRDTKLTDARYGKISQLLLGFDDHNTLVKVILIKSWFKCPNFSDPDHEHLDRIKSRVNFYAEMDSQLNFAIHEALKNEVLFWNRHFPGKRDGFTSSKQFVNIIEVRGYMEASGKLELINTSEKPSPKTDNQGEHCSKIAKTRHFLLDLLPEDDQKRFFESRTVTNHVRNRTFEVPPLLLDKRITVSEFFIQYFPDRVKFYAQIIPIDQEQI